MSQIADHLPTNPKSLAFLARLPTVVNDLEATDLAKAIARKALGERKPLAVIADETGLRKPVIEGILFHGTCPTKRTVRVLAHWLGLTEGEALGMLPGGWAQYRRKRGVGAGDLRPGWRKGEYVSRRLVSNLAHERSMEVKKPSDPPTHTGPQSELSRARRGLKAAVRHFPDRDVGLCEGCGQAKTIRPSEGRAHQQHGWATWHDKCKRAYQREAFKPSRTVPLSRLKVPKLGGPPRTVKYHVMVWLLKRVLGFTHGELTRAGVKRSDKVVGDAEKWIPLTVDWLFPDCGSALEGQPMRSDWYAAGAQSQKHFYEAQADGTRHEVTIRELLAKC